MAEPRITTEILESLHESLTLLHRIIAVEVLEHGGLDVFKNKDIENIQRALKFVVDLIDHRNH